MSDPHRYLVKRLNRLRRKRLNPGPALRGCCKPKPKPSPFVRYTRAGDKVFTYPRRLR
jgi:hypothetical protein